MDINYKKIGKRIASCRRMMRISQKELAEKSNITNNYLSNIENGHSIPSLEVFVSLCNALDKTPDYFLLGNIRNDDEKDIADELKFFSPEKRRLASEIIELLRD